MPNINDYITYIGNEDDVVYLKTPAFPVNMRLFKSSGWYRDIVCECCDYIKWLALTTMEGYKKSYGMSGANAAIPFNLIGVVRNRKKTDEYCQIMINPIIVDTSEETVDAESNCGSIRLEKSIMVRRYETVRVAYFDEDGEEHLEWFSVKNGGKTIQHETDHNLGVLITDKEIRDGKGND